MMAHRSPGGPDRRPDRRAPVAASVACLLLLAAIGTARAATVTVAAVNFEFQPASRSVHVGDVVRWTFAGDPHTVTSGTPSSPDGQFDSGIKDPGASFQVTFDTAGTFRYFCQVHPEQMTGTIVVTAGAESTPSPTAKPTAKPTARPTARPTAAPTVRPTASPTQTAGPPATPTASATSSATTAAASSSIAPTASAAPSEAGAVQSPSPSIEPLAGEPAAGVDPIPLAIGIVILLLVAGGGLALARRSRSAV
jgi:plastocyanin